jgi:spore maturation protein CgeB
MRVLIVGSNKEWAFENHYIKHLKTNGIHVESYPAHDIFYDFYYKHLINKLLFRLGISPIYRNINKTLIQLTQAKKFDVVWIFKGMEIFPETLIEIKKTGAKLVNFNPDHPFIHTFRGSGNKNVIKSIDCYDLHLCYNLSVKNKIETEYYIKCIWLPFGYEESEINIPQKQDEIIRVCFIGTPDKFRASTIKKMASNGIPIDLYGIDWEKWVPKEDRMDIFYHPPVYMEHFNTVAPRYRLQLNIFRPQNDNSHNMRTFEMPGLGCIMLAPVSYEHSKLFEDSKDAFFYKDDCDLINKALTILNMDYECALNIRKNALQRSIQSEYSYKKRTEYVIGVFASIL